MNYYLEFFVDHFGEYGHVFIPIIVCYLIFNMKKYMYGYVAFLFLGEILVWILKRLFKEERPLAIHNNTESYDYYGMPSGHSHHVMYSFVFLALCIDNMIALITVFFLCLIVMYERYKNEKHYISQIVTGGIIGAIYGYFTYFIVKDLIQNDRIESSVYGL